MSYLEVKLLQWNIQGFLCHKYALELLVSRYKPNIIALQETHIIERDLHLLHLPGFSVFHHNKSFDYAKSGIAIFISNNINVSSHTTSSCNLLFQSVTISCGQPLTITNIYKEHDIVLDTTLINQINHPNVGHHILIGDLNAHSTTWGSSSDSHCGDLWVDFAEDTGLVILNDGSPTLLSTRHTLTAIDVSMCSSDLAPDLTWSSLDMPEVGDHFPILISNYSSAHDRIFIPRFIDKKADWPLFRNKLSQFNENFQESYNVNREAAQIRRLFRKAANESIPLSRKPSGKNNPVWYNSTISKLIFMRQRAWRTFKRTRTQENGLIYRRSCARVKRECKIAKRRTWTNFLNSLNPFLDARILWNRVNNLRNSKKQSFSNICTAGRIISNPREIAGEFAHFWSSLSSNDAFDSDVIALKNNLDFDTMSSSVELIPDLLIPIDIHELDETLRNLKGSTPSLDKLTYPMVRNAPLTVKRRLCKLYNIILTSCTFPHDWKTAVLIPIPKKGKNPSHLEGYRPISLLPILSKILEKIIAKRLFQSTTHNFSTLQHAFLPRHGVHSLCHQLEEVLRNNLSSGKHSLVISADLEKAFDRVISAQIILELQRWGADNKLLRLIHSFLTNRRMLVKVDGHLSEILALDNGIPQGSPLSVILYNIYANTLARAIEEYPGMDFVGIYADNIFAVSSGPPEEVHSNLESFSHCIQDWARHSGAVIPPDKTEILHVCRRRSCRIESIQLSNHNIHILPHMQILGITFSKNLLWNEHIKHVIAKLGLTNNLLRLICSRKRGPHIDTAVNICRSLVFGILSHGITIYGWTSINNTSKLDIATRKCFRTATGLLRATPVDSLMVEGRFTGFKSLLEKFSINLASRAITLPCDGLHVIFWHHISSFDILSNSSIDKIILLILEFGITIPSKPTALATFDSILIDDSLSIHGKDITSPFVFKALLADKISTYEPRTILYTDGSFDGINNSFSVLRQVSETQYEIIYECRLPDRIGVFSTELTAVISAMTYASDRRGRTLICTDSLSVVRAIRTNHRGIFNYILPRAGQDNVIILWIPSHIGIAGNERADQIARRALNLPQISEPPCIPNAITSQYKSIRAKIDSDRWNRSEVFLKLINPSRDRANYNEHLSRADCIFLARLRVNKAIFNTKHYYDHTSPARCEFCQDFLSVGHILSECQSSKIDEPIGKILDCSREDMLPRIRLSLRVHGALDI